MNCRMTAFSWSKGSSSAAEYVAIARFSKDAAVWNICTSMPDWVDSGRVIAAKADPKGLRRRPPDMRIASPKPPVLSNRRRSIGVRQRRSRSGGCAELGHPVLDSPISASRAPSSTCMSLASRRWRRFSPALGPPHFASETA
jgi:hypothetical protein